MKNYIKLFWVVLLSIVTKPVIFYKQFVKREDLTNLSDGELQNLISDLPGHIIEAGAWDGQDTLRLLKLFSKSKLICFEPVPEMFELLSSIFLEQDQSIKIINRALTSSNSSELKFIYGTDLNPSGSLNTPVLHKHFPKKTNFDKEVLVKTYHLNNLFFDESIDLVNLLWLDVQGSELEIIKSIDETNLNKIRFIHLEVSKVKLYMDQPDEKDIVSYLQSKGFQIVSRKIPILSGNILFKNTKLDSRI